jgi:hypothetical protein
MNWLTPGEESVVSTTMLDDTTTAKRSMKCLEREKEAKIVAGVGMWWVTGLHPDNC